ncbi:MAG TPA: glycosyltransferase [Gammaproteobacteria bacterium]|nr:glycosyltransferase [Gammaproteobacteria bacterium]
MNTPPVSILLPFRDAHETLAECLDSIAAQTLSDYELLAIDDGSRDASAALVAQRAQRDMRIRLIRQPPLGLVAALNRGLGEARAPLIARMDADDRMHPERLAAQHAGLSTEPDLGLLATQVRPFPDARLQDGLREYIRWQNACCDPATIADEIYVESPFAHPSVMFRRCVVQAAGGYHAGNFPEDYDLWLRLARRGVRMAKLPRVLLDWRDSAGRLSRTDPRCSRQAFDRLRASYLARDPRLQDRPLAFWGAGRKTRRRCNLLIERGFTPIAWVDIDPRKIGNRLQGVPVVPPEWLARDARPFVLSYVANHGAREDIASRLETMGYERGVDYLMVG